MRSDQERIAEWLNERAPDLADVYRGAIRLLDDPEFPGRKNFICHAARDIASRTPDIITESQTKKVEMNNDLNALTELWTSNGLDGVELSTASLAGQKNAGVTSIATEIAIPYLLFKRVQIIVALQRKVLSNRNRAIKMLEVIAPENIGREEILFPLAQQWMDVSKWFQGHTHAGTTVQVVDEKELQNNFLALETFLDTVIREFFGPMDTLDEILENTNS